VTTIDDSHSDKSDDSEDEPLFYNATNLDKAQMIERLRMDKRIKIIKEIKFFSWLF
jgi:hypothetical protein